MTPLASAVGSRALWYLTRGSGAVSLLLLTAVVVLGVANVARWSPDGTPRFVVQRVHRDLSLLALVFIALHVATVVIDGFAPIRWIDAVLPFGSAYRPIWLGFGALALDLLVAIAITSLVRSRLGYGVWRAVHWTTYGTWVVALLHGAGVGSDTRSVWMMGLVAVSVGTVLAAVVWRVISGWDRWEPARVLLVAGAVLVPPALAVWMIAGPLRGGWALRAGTPPDLLAAAAAAAAAPSVPTIVLPNQADFSGSASLDNSSTGEAATLSTSAKTTDPAPLSLNISLDGEQEPAGFSVRSGVIRLIPPQGAAAYRGEVTSLDEGTLRARLSDGFGDVIDIAVQMSISASGQVQGELLIGAVSSSEVST
ncbi:MAG: ferric reductase-like transmembrane domain-containing protein [Actinomycetota bacterium]